MLGARLLSLVTTQHMKVFFLKSWCYGLGKENSLKTRIMTMIISKPISQGNGISFPISCALQRGNLLSLWQDGTIPNIFYTNQVFVSSTPEGSCLKSWNSYLVQHVCSEWRLSETVTQTESLTGLECWWLHPWNPPVLNACWLWWDFGGLHQKFFLSFDLWPLETMSLGMWDEHSWC